MSALFASCGGDDDEGQKSARDEAKGGSGGQAKGGATTSGGTSGTDGTSGTTATAGSNGIAGSTDSSDGGYTSSDGGYTGSDGGQTGSDGGQTGTTGGQTGTDAGSGGNSGGIGGVSTGYVCSPACGEGQMCCPLGIRTTCMPVDEEGCKVPDLTVTESETTTTLDIDFVNADADLCLIEEGCVGGPGLRRVLVFNAGTPNIGTGDLIVGAPTLSNPDFEYSTCHEHYHFSGYAKYELLDANGNIAATGHKQSYCMRDEEQVVFEPWVPPRTYYSCTGDLQGLSRGWSDVYKVGLDCQWVDITGVPPGDYFLRVTVNPDGRIIELDYDNNEIVVAVTIPP